MNRHSLIAVWAGLAGGMIVALATTAAAEHLRTEVSAAVVETAWSTRATPARLVLARLPADPSAGARAEPTESAEPARWPANRWVLVHREDASGGKRFARAVWAGNVGRLYLWGTGGDMPAPNVYRRYELEYFDPAEPGWRPALPEAAKGRWTADRFPPFRILGQSGPDGLKHDEGPRLQVVGGYHATNRVRFWDFDGVSRPSPIHTFNMACWDPKRSRILFYSDSRTFVLDPARHVWNDLEAANHPTCCQKIAWAMMAYDAGNDQVVLFGGGLATNPSGGAPTWIYDCSANVWRRPRLELEPPLRCNGAMIHDPVTGHVVLFGGYDQSAALNDTWVFDPRGPSWQRRAPQPSPPPMYAPAAALLPGGGKILVCGSDARKLRWHHDDRTSARRETWVYDIAADCWTPIDGGLELEGYDWLSADTAQREGVVWMVAFGPERRTYAMRYDPALPPAPAEELPGAPPGTVAWKYPEQKLSLEAAPPADRAAHEKWLAGLPPNRMIDAAPPGLLISKTWSTAVLDTDRSEILYVGGGHSGYSGNDVARYSIAENRWTLDFPPRFPPYLEGMNAGIFGWSYGMMPFSQHTYLWYAYDPVSKTMLYLARPSIDDGTEVQLADDPPDVFVYEAKQHGYASWVYDSARRRMHRPSFGRPFANPWHLSVLGTPNGVMAACDEKLYRAEIAPATGEVRWELFDAEFPKPRAEIRYHYEFQPLVYDTRRDRLVQLKGDEHRVDVYARPLDRKGRWEQLDVEGTAAIGREAVYIPKHDVILWLADRELFAYDCESRRIRRVEIDLPEGLYTHECALVYDARHDVCVALIPRSFTGPMQTFLLRYEPQ